MVFGTNGYVDPGAERVMQLFIAAGPLVALLLIRMVLGRSKEMILALWLSMGWLALRASLNPQMAFLRDVTRPIERLIQG